jgi:hypothetical protein
MAMEALKSGKPGAVLCLALSLQWHAVPLRAAAADTAPRSSPGAAGTTPVRALGAADLAVVVNTADPRAALDVLSKM